MATEGTFDPSDYEVNFGSTVDEIKDDKDAVKERLSALQDKQVLAAQASKDAKEDAN